MERRPACIARALERVRRVMALVNHAERLDRACAAVVRVGLVGQHAVDVHAGHVDVGQAIDDPVRHHATEPAARENADRVEAGCDEVTAQLGRLAHDRLQVGGEAFRSAEEFLHADLRGDGHARHGRLEVRSHAFPVGLQVEVGCVGGRTLDLPGRAHGFEQADHQATALLPVIAVAGWVLEHGHVLRQVLDRLGDQVVMLGGLVRDRDARLRTELARPQATAVDDVVRLDVAEGSAYAGDAAVFLQHAGCGHPFENLHATHSRAFAECHRDVDRVHAAVFLDVKAGLHVVDPGERKQLLDLTRRDFLHVDAAIAVERRHAPKFFEAVRVGGNLDEADRHESRCLSRLRLETPVEIARVLADLGRRLRSRAVRDHEPGRVPCCAGGQLVPLEQHDVFPAHRGQVISGGGADDAAADDDDACVRGERGRIGHGRIPGDWRTQVSGFE